MEKELDLCGWLSDDLQPIYFIGGGGKSSAITWMASELKKEDELVVIATTTKVLVDEFDWASPMALVGNKLSEPASILEVCRQLEGKKIPLVFESIWQAKNKYRGHAPAQLVDLQKDLARQTGRKVWMLIEADGARNRPVKAPYDHEPVSGAGTVVAVLGAEALGQPLNEKTIYGLEQVLEILNKDEDDILTAVDGLRLVTSPSGYSKGLEAEQTLKVLINQAEDPLVRDFALSLKEKLTHQGLDAQVVSLKKNREYF